MNRSLRGWRVRHKPMADINVVPYIDVSLVLLVIFMITAPLLESEVGIDLPQADAPPLGPTADSPIVVTVKADGGLFVALGGDEAKAVDNAGLREMVLAGLQARPGRTVLIRGEQTVAYGQVVSVMAALKKAGVARVGLLTRPEP